MALPFRYNVLSLGARPTSTVSSIGLVTVVIAVFAYLQAVTDSALNTMAGTGDPNTIIVLNAAAQSETVSGLGKDEVNLLETVPGVVTVDDKPVISAEMVAISSALPRGAGNEFGGDDVKINAAVRGVDLEMASAVRHGRFEILPGGRAFTPGTAEVIVGEAASRAYQNHGVGDTIEIGNRGVRKFEIVGIFSTGGTSADSEIWGYVETLRDVYARDRYSSARMVVPDEEAGRAALAYIEGPSIGLTAKTERDYFRDLSTNQEATQVLSVLMIVIMGIAAAFAVANTMYAAVAGRTREIGMLRAIGFGRSSVLLAFIIEGLLIALMGGVLGVAASLLWHGAQRNILPVTFTTVSYQLEITPKIAGVCVIVALVIGLIGALMPAWRAARMNVVRALREV